jgi:SSS family transporter
VPGLEGVTNWMLPGLSPTQASLVISILVMGIATIIYTYLGGMSAVIWTEFVQLVIYLAGALIAAWILLGLIPGGWHEVVSTGTAAGKFNWFDFTFDLTRSYTFWSGVIGGAFLTTATHGTDQLMVQRYLCSRSTREARIALLTSGAVIFVQFMLFLLIGVMLFVYYQGEVAGEIAGLMVNGRVQSDRIFPQFIVQHLPAGILGLVVAAIFAAAMSTLASSLNSSAATAIGDFYLPLTKGERSDRHYLRVSKFLTALWGCLQIAVALAAIQFSRSAVDEVLGIASFTNGVILGVFFLGTLTKRVGQQAAFVGILVGATVMLFVKLRTGISWQWYVLIGSITTFLVGYAASWSRLDRTRPN